MAVTTSASARVCAWVTPGSASRATTQAEIQKVGFFAFIEAPFVSDERTSGHRALPVGNRPMHDLRSSPRIGISSLYFVLNFSSKGPVRIDWNFARNLDAPTPTRGP